MVKKSNGVKPVTRKDVEQIVKREFTPVVEKLDLVMGELSDMRDEYTLQMGKYESISELENTVEDHEKRIHKLERPTI